MNTGSEPRPTREDTPIVGSGPMPDALRNQSLPELPDDCDRLTADLTVLISRNAGVLNFRAPDLSGLDSETKRVLMADLQRALGIKPVRRSSP